MCSFAFVTNKQAIMNVTLDNNTYGIAASYANLHNISIADAIKTGLMLLVGNKQQKARTNIRPVSELHPSVQALIGIAKQKGVPEIKDINGEKIVEEYLTEKYR